MDRKSIFRALLIGGAMGELLTVWLMPKYILWYFDPPVQMGFSCKEPIIWALQRLQSAQLVGLGAGAVAGFVAWYLIRQGLAARKTEPLQ